jgi:hypothetical protein
VLLCAWKPTFGRLERRHEQHVSSLICCFLRVCYAQPSIPLTLVCTSRMFATLDLQRQRRHEQLVSSKRVCPMLRCYAQLRVARVYALRDADRISHLSWLGRWLYVAERTPRGTGMGCLASAATA